MLCGVNPAAMRLLTAIGLPLDNVPRFRDVWVNKELTEVTVHTRTGGGNREEYEQENAVLQAHPLYLRDADDVFDCTFADFTFRLPKAEGDKFMEEIKEYAGKVHQGEGREAMVESIIAEITDEPRKKFDKIMAELRVQNGERKTGKMS